ncbi:MAG: LVIVD repeat-containing protein [Candidatus Heimdallarchaeota archaeon]
MLILAFTYLMEGKAIYYSSIKRGKVSKTIVILIFCFILFFSMCNFLNLGINQQLTTAVDLEQGQFCEKKWHFFNFNFGEFVVEDDVAYLLDSSRGFVIANLSNPEVPEIIHYEPIFGFQRHIFLYDDCLFVISRDLNSNRLLRIYNVSDSTDPILLTEFSLSSQYYDYFCIGDDIAYLAADNVLSMINVTNKQALAFTNSTTFDGTIQCMSIQNDQLYISLTNLGLAVYDISNPVSLILIDNYNGSDSGLFPFFVPYSMQVAGNYIYTPFPNGVMAINCTDITNLTYGGRIDLNLPDYQFSAITSNDDLITLTNVSNFIILDKNNDSHPLFIDTIDDYVIDLVIANDYLFTTYAALHIYDLSNPSDITLTGTLSNDYPESFMCVDVKDDYVYFSDTWTGMYIYDISNLDNPQQVGFFERTYGYFNKIYVFNNYLIAYNFPHGLQILDITNPANPIMVAAYSSFLINGVNTSIHSINDIYIDENYLYLITYENKFVIIDISSITTPIALGSYAIIEDCSGISIEGNEAYIGTETGLLILNIRDKNNPKLAGTFVDEIGYGIYDVAVSGKYAVCSFDETIELLNVGQAGNVKKVSVIDDEYSGEVGIDGQYAWARDSKSFRIYNLVDPKNPVFTAYYFDNESIMALDPWDLNPVITDIVFKDNLAFCLFESWY